MKPAAHRGQREYRFAAWTHGGVRPGPGGPGCVARAGRGDAEAAERARGRRPRVGRPGRAERRRGGEPPKPLGSSRARRGAAGRLSGHRAAALRGRGPAGELRETAAVHAAVEALRAAVGQLNAESSRDAAAAPWHAEPVVRFFCATYAGTIAAVRVNEDSFIVIRAEVPGDDVIDVTIAVGPDGTCACRVSTAQGDRASASPDARSLEDLLKSRLAEAGVQVRDGNAGS